MDEKMPGQGGTHWQLAELLFAHCIADKVAPEKQDRAVELLMQLYALLLEGREKQN